MPLKVDCVPGCQYVIRNTQYAIRRASQTDPTGANTQYAIRNTQYVKGLKTVCELGCQYVIRNTQYAKHLKVDCALGCQHAIRNTQYVTPLKVGCEIRNCLPQYATRQYVTYPVFYTSHLRTVCGNEELVRTVVRGGVTRRTFAGCSPPPPPGLALRRACGARARAPPRGRAASVTAARPPESTRSRRRAPAAPAGRTP